VILVTGAGGFIGRRVCAQLLRENLPFLGVDRRPPAPSMGSWRTVDVTDRGAVAGLFRSYSLDTVIHLAAMLPSACRLDPSQATAVNIAGSANLLEAAAAARVKRFVFGSSMSVYGHAGDGTPLSEDAAAAPVDLYGAGKRYVEIYGETLARRGALSFVALRIATVVGPGARHTASPWRSEIFEKVGSGVPQTIAIPFSAEAILSLVHVEDVARMLVLLATRADAPAPAYNTPAENWTAGALKGFLESLDPNVTVELGGAGQTATPPVADGARFVRDFAWHASTIASWY